MLKELLKQAIALAPPQSWPTYDGLELDRQEFLTSSQVASCLRMTGFEKHSTVKVDWAGNGYTERGHAIEAWLVKNLRRLEALGYKLEYMGEDQVSFYDPDIGLSGTPDGILTLPTGEKVLLEFKSIDPRSNKSNLPKKKHIYQTTQNIYLVNKCLKLAIMRGFLIYLDASDVFNVHETEVIYDPYIVQEVIARAEKLWAAKDGDELPAEGIVNGDCDYCPFHAQCSEFVSLSRQLEVAKKGDSLFSLGERIELSDHDLMIAKDYAHTSQVVKHLEKTVLDPFEEEFKETLKAVGGRCFIDQWEVSYTEYPGKETLDKEALIADGINLWNYTKVGKPYGVVRIKMRKD